MRLASYAVFIFSLEFKSFHASVLRKRTQPVQTQALDYIHIILELIAPLCQTT